MRIILCGCLVAVSAWAQGAPSPAVVAEHVTAQNKLFDEYYEAELKASPERATSFGDYRYNALLGDRSLAGIAREEAVQRAFLVRLRTIPVAGMTEQDRVSHEILQRELEQGEADYTLKTYEMPVNQFYGVHTGLADLPLSMPFDTVKHYEDYVARLHAIPRVLAQTTAVMQAGQKDGLMPVRFLLEKIPVQCEGIAASDPFLLPTKKYPASISAEDQTRLTAAITDAVNTDVLPAYAKFAAFVRTEYAPHGRTALALTSLPDGQRRYANAVREMTTTDLTPEQIHQLGLKEVVRITGEMAAIAKAQGFADLASFRASINKNPKWTPVSTEQILDDYRKYIAQMEPKLPELFNILPKSPVTVEGIPAFQAAMATHYQNGTPDGKRPGRVSVAVVDPTHRTLVLDEAVAYHEGIPGHHMQRSVQQQMTGLPKFRQHAGFTAYTEGWALYAEELGKEVGFYTDPVSDYGRLNSELFRAVRLVVDTGIHAKGWTRDQVVAYMRENDVNEPLIQSETDRYIALPAQALAYKLGQLKIRELRERSKEELGARFDLKAFHDEVLSGGALPLDVLDARIAGWAKGLMPVSASVGVPVSCHEETGTQ